MSLTHRSEETFDPDLGLRQRFRLILVESGSGILRVTRLPAENAAAGAAQERRFAFLAPVVFCLDECERPVLEKSVDLRAQAIYFHPGVLNTRFNFDSIRNRPPDFNATDIQDREWLLPFLRRGDGYNGQLHLGPGGTRQVARLMQIVGQQIVDQPDNYWPCRARSYLLELLFLLERLLTAAENGETIVPLNLPDQPCEAEPVILYLHTHYRSKITLSDLARQFHTNRTSLEDHFAHLTGQPVMSYLINLRVHLAALMLRETLLPVSEIMERVGFSDSTHFGRTFRKWMGMAPRDYRDVYNHMHER